MKRGLYQMPITKGWFNNYIHYKDFNKAKCPICHKYMTSEENAFSITFTCKNPKCKGYYRWLGKIGKSFLGYILLEETAQ